MIDSIAPLFSESSRRYYGDQEMLRLSVFGVVEFRQQGFHVHVPVRTAGIEVGAEIEFQCKKVLSYGSAYPLLLGDLRSVGKGSVRLGKKAEEKY